MELTLERCQAGDYPPDESNACDGEAGRGVYAYLPNQAMRAYYSAQGERCYRLHMTAGDAADLSMGKNLARLVDFVSAEVKALETRMPGYRAPTVSAGNVQRFGRLIEVFVQQTFPKAHVYMVPHKGPGIPTGVQAIIRDMSVFTVERVRRVSA